MSAKKPMINTEAMIRSNGLTLPINDAATAENFVLYLLIDSKPAMIANAITTPGKESRMNGMIISSTLKAVPQKRETVAATLNCVEVVSANILGKETPLLDKTILNTGTINIERYNSEVFSGNNPMCRHFLGAHYM